MNSTQTLPNLGARIKALRTMKGMTQHELAFQCNFEKASMSRIEAGRTNITIRTLYKIAQALETDLHVFFQNEPIQAAATA